LEKNLSFELGKAEIAGLEEFYRRAGGIVSVEPQPIRFVEDFPSKGVNPIR
jgi:hypothetical protein